jgi:hypothetical protein
MEKQDESNSCIKRWQVVKGYSKSTEYLPGEEFVDTRYRNTW